MSIKHAALKTLPRLRRFGTMLTGATSFSDALIMSTILELIETQDITEIDDVETFLFRVFLEELVIEVENPGNTRVDPALQKLNFVERQIFLLRYVESFDRHKVSQIVSLSVDAIVHQERQLAKIMD